MNFDELWEQVEGLSDMTKRLVPDALTASTKKKLERKKPKDIEQIVLSAIDEVNCGSVISLDELIRKRL